MRNRAKRLTNGACQYKGVFRDNRRDKIFAKIYLPDGPLWLGYFDDEESAARAYDFEAVKWFREFAHVNFPDEWPPERRQEIYSQYPNPTRPPRHSRRKRKEDQ